MRTEDKIQIVDRYMAEDDNEFADLAQAIGHQKRLDLKTWYDSNGFMQDGEQVKFDDVFSWMQSKGEEFLNQLKAL